MDFVILGPSGSGKSTLAQRVVSNIGGLHLALSYTTRTQKPGEINGRHYNFVSEYTFAQMRANNQFEEYAQVNGNWYGTPKSEAKHENTVFEIDCQGADEIKKKRPGAKRIFILPPSREEVERRLRERKRDNDEEIARRLSLAAHEVARASDFECWLVNDHLEPTVKRLEGIVLFFLLNLGSSIPSAYRDHEVLERVQSTFVAQPA